MFFKLIKTLDDEPNTEGLKIVYDDLAPYAKETVSRSSGTTALSLMSVWFRARDWYRGLIQRRKYRA